MNMLNVQVQEMKSMSNSIQKLEGTKKLLYNQIYKYDIAPMRNRCLYITLQMFGA